MTSVGTFHVISKFPSKLRDTVLARTTLRTGYDISSRNLARSPIDPKIHERSTGLDLKPSAPEARLTHLNFLDLYWQCIGIRN